MRILGRTIVAAASILAVVGLAAPAFADAEPTEHDVPQVQVEPGFKLEVPLELPLLTGGCLSVCMPLTLNLGH